MGHPMDSEIDARLKALAEEEAKRREVERQAKKHRIYKVICDHESLCLDDHRDRMALLAALMEVM